MASDIQNSAGPGHTTPQKTDLPVRSNGKRPLTPLQKRLVVWMASGKSASAFANKNAMAIVPKHEGSEKKLKQKARHRCRKWSQSEAFREALWNWSVNQLDLSTPAILQGVAAKAAAGRVDAARLALEITGRHAPNVDVQPAQIQIVMGGVPRPAIAPTVDVVDGDAEEIVDGEDEDAI